MVRGAVEPIDPDGNSVIKPRSTVPVKFVLTGASADITDLVAKFSYAKINDETNDSVVIEGVSTSAATDGNLFRYDPTSQGYIFNWSTKGLTDGTYEIYIDFPDGVRYYVEVGLR